MEKDIFKLFIPAGLLDQFDIEGFEQKPVPGSIGSKLYIYLTEKNQLGSGYNPSEWESKGFCKPKTIQDFAIRTNLVYLVIKCRSWSNKSDPNRIITNDLSFLAKGTKLTAELSAFLKGTGRYA